MNRHILRRSNAVCRSLGTGLAVAILSQAQPASAASVTFTANRTLTADSLAYENFDVTVTNAATLSISGAHRFNSLSVTSSAKVSPAGTDSLRLAITSLLTVATGCRLDATGRGFGSNGGPGAGGSRADAAGGSHGGTGGVGASGAPLGSTYDSILQPAAFGSGGGSSSTSGVAGGAGGGAIRLWIGGSAQIDGDIRADGSNGILNSSGSSGGGAGGSIYMRAGSLGGAGIISATGGLPGASGFSGAGGGGRISISYSASTFSGSMRTYGAAGTYAGGAGSVATQLGASPPSIVYDNGTVTTGTTEIIGPAALGGAVRVRRGAILAAPAGQSLAFAVNGDLTVETDGAISMNGRGFGAVQGPGAGATRVDASGGSYGGSGGTSGVAAPVASTYGSYLLTVLDMGSGGGSSSGSGRVGGAGGGAMQLDVTGTLQIDGQVRASGIAGILNSQGSSGGGSGGSIRITAGLLSGAGQIAAQGGAAGATCCSGAGGGGRIVVFFDNSTFTGSIRASGGTGTFAGSPGTVFTKQTGAAQGTIQYDNLGVQATTVLPAPATFDGVLRVRGGTVLAANAGQTLWLTVNGNLVVETDGALSMDSRGYGAAQGPGAGATRIDASGGSYGGTGGSSDVDAPVAPINGSFELTPAEAGSGGGSSSRSGKIGGSGGGMVRLDVNGGLQVDGIVRANGGAGILDITGSSGGGSGGSIRLNVNTLSGSGQISASGGAPGATCCSGGGGGGRIALYYDTNSFTGTIRACGGVGNFGGGPGTVFSKQRSAPAGEVLYSNCGVAAATELPAEISFNASLRLASGTKFIGPKAQLLWITVHGDFTLESTCEIFATGRGFGPSQGPGAGSNSIDGSGGGYGGYGGSGAGPGVPGGAPYGSATEPVDAGSGGGSSVTSGVIGGMGGGAIRLLVDGTARIDGNVLADGTNGILDSGGSSAGGSGGGIYIAATEFTGNGILSAKGGKGGSNALGNGAGGGGGGRIAAYSEDCSPSFPTANIFVNGGGGATNRHGLDGTISTYIGFESLPGAIDEFVLPAEPASPSLDLVRSFHHDVIPFDPTPGSTPNYPANVHMAHTYRGLPAGVTGATLTVRVRAGDGNGGESTDRIILGFADAAGFPWAWMRYFGSDNTPEPGLTPGRWSQGTTQTFVFDLANLPLAAGGFVNLIPQIAAHGYLDLDIEDDSGVDYAHLSLTTCTLPPTDSGDEPVSAGAARQELWIVNPLRESGTVVFSLLQSGPVRVDVLDVSGRIVKTLAHESYSAGMHRVAWDPRGRVGQQLPSGVYFVRLHAIRETTTRKVVYLQSRIR